MIGFEPIQSETPDLQSGPALPLRRIPMIAIWSFDNLKNSGLLTLKNYSSPDFSEEPSYKLFTMK